MPFLRVYLLSQYVSVSVPFLRMFLCMSPLCVVPQCVCRPFSISVSMYNPFLYKSSFLVCLLSVYVSFLCMSTVCICLMSPLRVSPFSLYVHRPYMSYVPSAYMSLYISVYVSFLCMSPFRVGLISLFYIYLHLCFYTIYLFISVPFLSVTIE